MDYFYGWQVKISCYVRPTRFRHVDERSRYIWEGLDSHLSPQLNQNPSSHTHANNAQTSCKDIRHIPQEAYTSLLPLCLILTDLSWLLWPGRNDNGGKRDMKEEPRQHRHHHLPHYCTSVFISLYFSHSFCFWIKMSFKFSQYFVICII